MAYCASAPCHIGLGTIIRDHEDIQRITRVVAQNRVPLVTQELFGTTPELTFAGPGRRWAASSLWPRAGFSDGLGWVAVQELCEVAILGIHSK